MNKEQPFRQHHVTRLLKAAASAGVPNPTVEVHLSPTGTRITVGSGRMDEAPVMTKPGKARSAARDNRRGK